MSRKVSDEHAYATESSTVQLLTTSGDVAQSDAHDTENDALHFFSPSALYGAQNFELIRTASDPELGRGEFGRVVKASLNMDGELYDVAVKLFNKKSREPQSTSPGDDPDWRRRTVEVTNEAVCSNDISVVSVS
jgi:hypothetical protein